MIPTSSRLILLSAGGTGGHMYPAAALAKDLVSRGYQVELLTDARGAKFRHIFGDIPVHILQAGTLGSGILGKIKGLTRLALGMAQAHRLIGRIKPAVVVGFGGYPSVPGMYAAQRRGVPTVIHEQNAVLGRANVMLAPKADKIALSVLHVEGLAAADTPRAVVTGNPVREEIAALYTRPYPILQADGPLKIFVMGGSLGAHIFSEIVPKALAKLPVSYRNRLEITQQCRSEDLESVRLVYNEAGIRARLDTFFNDVPDILTHCHLVISRSGASTVAEVTTAGRPAIFVPMKHADQQQTLNAERVADTGGAWVMPQSGFTEEALLARIETFLQSPQTLFRAAEAARACGKPDAARRLGNLVTAMAAGWDKDDQTPTDLSYLRD